MMMRWSQTVLRYASSSSRKAHNNNCYDTSSSSSSRTTSRGIKSLALSVYFKQPDFGMKDYEILSRASAFLLSVDPPDILIDKLADGTRTTSPYAHLDIAEQKRKAREYKRTHGHSQAGGPPGRQMMDLSWLEFVPKEVRPKAHVVCSSHVVSPFLWKDYYPQPWLTQVRQEHCVYSLEVYDSNSNNPEESVIAKFALNSEPFHHPEGRDVALLHLREEEESSLKLLKKLGVEMLHLRNPDKLYQKGEEMIFDGFVVSERNVADKEEYDSSSGNSGGGSGEQQQEQNDDDDDLRVFYPHVEHGKLSFHTNERFFATTPTPLGEGLCGAPVLDTDGDLCGVVEGIVPIDHANKKLAGNAAFMPSYIMQAFVDYVERGLVEQMMPKDLFQMVVTAKKTNTIGGGVFKATDDEDGKFDESDWEEAYDMALNSLKKRYSQDEVDAIMATVERERKEVLDIMDQEDDVDMDEVIERVRTKTMQIRELVHDQYRKGQLSVSQLEEGGQQSESDASSESVYEVDEVKKA